MPSLGSGYTFEDFLQRLERSPVSQLPPLYHEHRELFLHRPDIFTKTIGSLAWEKGELLITTANTSQSISVDAYRALLARMLKHNQFIRRHFNINHINNNNNNNNIIIKGLVPWQAAFRTYSEAILAHGNAVPTRMTISTLRLLAPHRQWAAAISLLKLNQTNEKMTIPMLIDAAACCATPTAWEMAMKLLKKVHIEAPDILTDSIQSLRPLGTNSETTLEAANALMPNNNNNNNKLPTPEQHHILSVLNDVVSVVPLEIALKNEMCVSYLTHLAASTTFTTQQKISSLIPVTRQFPWEVFMKLMMTKSISLPVDKKVLESKSFIEFKINKENPKEINNKNKVEISPLNSLEIRESIQLLQSEPETAVAFIAAIVDKLPSAESAASFLSEGISKNHDNTNITSSLRHPLVLNALLKKCSEKGSWKLASSILLSMSPMKIPCDVASELIIQMRNAKQASLVVDILQKCIVPTKTKLSQEAIEAMLVCILAHNRAINVISSQTSSKIQNFKTNKNKVHWRSAVSWSTDLLQEEIEARILQTGTDISKGGVSYSNPKLIPRMKPMSHRVLSLLIHICVSAGNPKGALQAIGYARTVNKTELFMSEEIRAILYCMIYNRPYEAEAIVKQSIKKYGKEKGQYLERLLEAAQEGKECEVNISNN